MSTHRVRINGDACAADEMRGAYKANIMAARPSEFITLLRDLTYWDSVRHSLDEAAPTRLRHIRHSGITARVKSIDQSGGNGAADPDLALLKILGWIGLPGAFRIKRVVFFSGSEHEKSEHEKNV